MPDNNEVEVNIKPLPSLLIKRWRWEVHYDAKSVFGFKTRKRKAGVGFGRQDAIDRARAFLDKKGLAANVPGDQPEGL